MEGYNLTMFTHAMDFFKERVNLKELIPKKNLQTSLTICRQTIW